MKTPMKAKTWGQAILVIVILATVLPPRGVIEASGQPAPASLRQSDLNHKVYLPLVTRTVPRPRTIFGVEMSGLDTTWIDRARDANVYWVRYYGFSWAQIEPVRTATPTYKWSVVDEAGLIEAANRGLKVVATVKLVPSWAQKFPGISCGPVASDSLDEFAQFMRALVKRYSAYPYNIKYWEIGNEVDVDPKLVPSDSIIGCWGDEEDRFYGGGYYAEMLQQVYPAVKAADSQATVLIGGLLLDCDPANPPPGKTCKSSRFLEGILRKDGGAYFDIVSFHAYPYYTISGTISELTINWPERGGVLLGKISFLRDVMAEYDIDKPMMITESSVVCAEWLPECALPSNAFLEAQADYVTWLYVRSWAENIQGVMWYSLEDSGWRSSSLYKASTPKPAYFAYQFAAKELTGATLTGPLTQFTGLTGYAFRSTGKRIWALWSPTRTNTTITVPAGVLRVYNKYGNRVTPVSGRITVNSPVYIELSP